MIPFLDPDLLTAEVIPAGALETGDISAWRAITAANPALDSPFFSPDFTLAVAATRDDVHVAMIRERGLPLAYLPFQFAGPWQRRASAAERVGGHLSDFFGLIAVPDLPFAPADLLRLSGLNAFTFTHLCTGQAKMLDGDRPEAGLRANLASGWKSYWAGRRAAESTFAADTERNLSKVVDGFGTLRFTFDDHDPDALTRLIAAKRAQCGADDVLAAPWTRQLLATLARTRAIHCTGLVSTLYAGETWVASHFGICSSRTLHYWFPVHNPELARFSPERLLLRAILEAAAGRRIATVDFGADDDAHKRAFATSPYQVYRGDWYRPGLASLGYRMAQSMAWRLKAARPDHAASNP